LVFAAGAAGIEFVPSGWLEEQPHLRFAADVNAVMPVGLADIDPLDAGVARGQTVCYGAIGIGNLKMKLHKQCLRQLFESNDQVLDVDEVFAIGQHSS
ncbi:MAG TPA: bifunctional NADP-dependent methylenetetrahydromethanopterin dehydrogenase/methylenetetrahydrofolate dehydrogenase, partial [Pirellulaceae bacterium]|nr:bifunctional NADP-dependent methylenetetrahydromethanopterin dehydrogenase/methylenetetrahydrofolate dehydrogenase [Pirellulaceae bacterium]